MKRIENLICDRADDSVSKYVNGFEYQRNVEDILAVFEVVMILNFF